MRRRARTSRHRPSSRRSRPPAKSPCAALARLVLVDQAGVQVGVDRHLLARHRVEGEARADLGDAAGALGDDDEVDHHQDDEHDDADRVVAADQEVAEGLDHLARRVRAGMALQQHDAGRGHVERQPQQRRDQQHRREHREVERLLGVQATSSTMIESAMLNVNSRSSANGGSGSTIIARIRTMKTGAPTSCGGAPLRAAGRGCAPSGGGRPRIPWLRGAVLPCSSHRDPGRR
jgi:hypothetical protein